MVTTYEQQQSEQMASALREQLVIEHLPQVHFIASRIHERLPKHIPLDDLVSAGIIGLIAAIDNFDFSRNTKLRTYAEHKIRGHILNSVGKLSGTSRHLSKLRRDVQRAISAAEQRIGGLAAAEDVSAELGMTLEEYHAALNELQLTSLGSLEAVDNGDDSQCPLKYVADPQTKTPEELIERARLHELITSSLANMPEQERVVLSFYYLEGLNLREISEIMNLHITRISQIKTQAILRLRAHIAKLWPGKVNF
jgi:RNA polymerase sigma factor for flagellar operon FliA